MTHKVKILFMVFLIKLRRAENIIWMVIGGVTSPSLGRKVRISDIWKEPRYFGGYDDVSERLTRRLYKLDRQYYRDYIKSKRK